MAEPEHVLRAILMVYVEDEEKYVRGTGALTALLARLTTAETGLDRAIEANKEHPYFAALQKSRQRAERAEAERDEWREKHRASETDWRREVLKREAAEARVEAAEQAFTQAIEALSDLHAAVWNRGPMMTPDPFPHDHPAMTQARRVLFDFPRPARAALACPPPESSQGHD